MAFEHIQLRRDTAANWTADNPILLLGETGWETDTLKTKLGDGTTTWNSLAYANITPAQLASTAAGQNANLMGFYPHQTYNAGTVGFWLANGLIPNLNTQLTFAPAGIPTLTASTGAGVLTGTYGYVITFYTATGETDSSGETTYLPVTAKNIVLTAIPTSSDPTVIGRKIYRTYNGAVDVVLKNLVATIADNTTTTYTDSVPDGSLGVPCPRLNSTGGNGTISGIRNAYNGPGNCASYGANTMLNNTGYANSAFGPNALTANTTGFRNCAFGIFSLYANTTGQRNTAMGTHTLGSNVDQSDSTALGYGALINANASGNTAVGSGAMTNNLTGVSNCAFGQGALQFNLASENCAFGYNASYANAGGIYNASFGCSAMQNGTSGNFNSAFGSTALTACVTGSSNTAVGALALTATTGSDNTAVGASAANTVLGGGQNTAVGSNSLQKCTTGSDNTAIGFQAGSLTNGTTTGNNNMMLGYGADPASASASNVITLGNASIATLRCQVTSITALSDARDKTDVATLAYGVDFIDQLRPISFTWSTRDGAKVGIKDAGFLAQEMAAAEDEAGAAEVLRLVDHTNPERLEATYGHLIPVLVKAIQELSVRVKELEAR